MEICKGKGSVETDEGISVTRTETANANLGKIKSKNKGKAIFNKILTVELCGGTRQ